jgi:hypothetical protein
MTKTTASTSTLHFMAIFIIRRYLEPLSFCSNGWEGERGRPTQNVHNEVITVQGGVRNGRRNMNSDNEDIQDYHSW